MIRKILCFLGFHDFSKSQMYFLYTEGIKSVYRIDKVCKYCGKEDCGLIKFPKI